MPARGERAAPTFDQTKPRELTRFFEELEYLFDRAALADETEKKKHLLRYVDFEVEQVWKSFPEFSDVTKSYLHFKAAILVHYPDASGDYVYSLRDMDLLIGERQRVGISNTVDLSDYHLKFLAITTWLIEKQQLGTLEQQRGYLRAFQPRLLGAINNRLQMKHPDHHPNIPHKIEDVYEAARFILQSATTAPQNYFAPSPSNVNPPFVPDGAVSIAKREPSIKQEDFGTLFTEFTKSIVEAINQNQGSRGRYPGAGSSDGVPRQTNCNFCGGPHFIRECDKVEDMIRAGKCKRNIEGKVVLPSGAFVPREIPGTLLSERIEEWHRRNPNQLAAVTLLHTIGYHDSSNKPSTSTSDPVSKPAFQLSTSDRIATIEAELFNLRARNKFTPLVRTRAQKAREPTLDETDDEDAAAVRAARQPRIEEVEDEDAPHRVIEKEAPAVAEPPIIPQPVTTPEHPYQNAKDAAYAPPNMRNVGAPIKAPAITKKVETAYKVLPAVHDPAIAVDVYKRSMEAPITITQRELLSLSPEVRSKVRDETTTRRLPNILVSATGQNALQIEEDFCDESLDNASSETLFSQRCCSHGRGPPRGAIILPDPIERYIRSLPPGQEPDPDRLIIAKESSAVRSIAAIIDNTKRRECILDPGCQIVAMSEETCHALSLAYDPTIRLNMQSANGNTDWSLGLARNVPFTIGSVTLYMQVHIIASPAYDVLLGRPFDILTESIVRNFANEDQTITITDPNTLQRYTIPTFPRGRSFPSKIAGRGFHD